MITVGSRREARELALICLHQWDQREPDEGRELAEDIIESRAPDAETAAYTRTLLAAFWEHQDSVDAQIAGAAAHWSLARMAVVDRAVLRLAVAEFLHVPSVPARVTMDEAIELAKKYSTAKSGAFVNGILDRIVTDWEQTHGPR